MSDVIRSKGKFITFVGKFVTFVQNNPIYIVLGVLSYISQLYQTIDSFICKVNEVVTIDWKIIIFIICSTILIVIMFILLYKNSKNNNILKSIPYQISHLTAMKNMGIVQCIPELENTDFDPSECMKTIKKKLLYMGFGGAKWVRDTADLELYKKMLSKIIANNGEIKCLFINPDSKNFNFKLMKKQNKGAIGPVNSYIIWSELVKEYYPYLQVRCYEDMPSFRLQLMDDNLMAVSRYQFEREWYSDEANKQRWALPYLIIDNNHETSLFRVFEKDFNDRWKKAIDIRKINSVQNKIKQKKV